MDVTTGSLVKFMRLGYLDELYGILEEETETAWIVKYPMMNAIPRKYLEKPPMDVQEGMKRFFDTFHPVPIAGPAWPYAIVPKGSSYFLVVLDKKVHQWLVDLLETGYTEVPVPENQVIQEDSTSTH